MLKRCVTMVCAMGAAAVSAAAFVPVSQAGGSNVCQATGAMMRLPELREASGLAASRSTPGLLWTHNDSGKPEIFAVDTKGKVTGRVSVTGANVVDWEAIASGPCGSGNCLYIADIGDNSAERNDVTIYRVPEPAKDAGTARADGVFRASYPDGAHDAEAMLVAPDGALYIVTKGETGPIALYRFPRELKPGTAMRLERVGSPLSKGKSEQSAHITDGAISPDGDSVVLRTRNALMFYRAADFLKGDFREARRADLKGLGEPQGEGVAFGPSNTVYVAGEGGGKSQPGTLAALTCAR